MSWLPWFVALAAGEARITFRLAHGTAAETLRDHGSFVGTVVDGVETRLRDWGFDPPANYQHTGTENDRQVYAGALTLP